MVGVEKVWVQVGMYCSCHHTITCIHLFTTSSSYFNTGGEARVAVEKVWVQVEKV